MVMSIDNMEGKRCLAYQGIYFPSGIECKLLFTISKTSLTLQVLGVSFELPKSGAHISFYGKMRGA